MNKGGVGWDFLMCYEGEVFILTTERGNVSGGVSSFKSHRGLFRTFKLREVDFNTMDRLLV